MNYLKGRRYKGLSHRKTMPQFQTPGAVRKFDAEVRKRGFTVKNVNVDPRRLRPMQRYVSAKRAAQIDPLTTKSRILVSRDGGIVDGHHRWAAADLRMRKGVLPKTFRIAAREYGMNAERLLQIARAVSRTRHGDLH